MSFVCCLYVSCDTISQIVRYNQMHYVRYVKLTLRDGMIRRPTTNETSYHPYAK
jgi:hypothetical protein